MEIADFCRHHGLKLNKDLGQHFLIDVEVLSTIVDTANIQPDDHLLEIGAGIGILTTELLRKESKVTAIEIDKKLIHLLNEYVITNVQLPTSNLSIVHSNALSTPFPTEPYKIVANIPYHITSPLLRHTFLESPLQPTSMTLLIQREVAEKIVDEKNAGLLTILVGLFGKPTLIRTVPPEAFLPPPKVDSAILHIDCFETPLAGPPTLEEIFRLTKHAFSGKRKMLSNTIGALHGGKERLEKVGIDATRRPQTLSVEEWIALARTGL